MNPALGVLYHWIGGLAAASFYLPYRGVKNWSWETYWLVGGFFSWIVAPWIFAWMLVPDLGAVLQAAPRPSVAWAYFFGALWGIGGLTFGLTMRYLGVALGMAVALGFCAAFGTIVPPIFNGEFGGLLANRSGQWVLAGVGVCLAGIGLSGLAGMSKERELPDEAKKQTVREFNFAKGIGVAVFSGVLSACMSYGFAAGRPIAQLAAQHLKAKGAPDLWQNLPVLIIVLAGGFTTNFIWCVALNFRNRSGGDYLGNRSLPVAERPPLSRNYLLAAFAGILWYLQFFFYSMGETQMGRFGFSSWTLHMASIIIFSTLWGVALKEWRGTSSRTHRLVLAGVFVLIASTCVVGYGNYLGTH